MGCCSGRSLLLRACCSSSSKKALDSPECRGAGQPLWPLKRLEEKPKEQRLQQPRGKGPPALEGQLAFS